MPHGEIFVWESRRGWKVVEAWRDARGCPYGRYVVVADGLRRGEACGYAGRLRRSLGMI